jgi:LPXTG-site transpeptidase (sortase) family protein
MRPGRVILCAVLGLFLLLAAWGVVQGVRIYPIVKSVRAHGMSLLALRTASPTAILSNPTLEAARGEMNDLNAALAELQDTMALELAVAGRMKWMPLIGGDIASVPILLDAATGATAAADAMLVGLEPVVKLHQLEPLEARAFAGDGAALAALEQSSAQWQEARRSLERVTTDLERWQALPRGRIVAPRIDPYLEKIDPLIPLAREALETLASRPRVIDALVGLSRPRSYLVLLQNSWEMRPTGGFITAAVVVTVAAGQFELSPFLDSYRVDLDYGALPPPPTTLRNALWGGIWTFRDANWSPDFPTSAKWARDLYLIGRDQEIDGVIALNPVLVENLLTAVGPLSIPSYETEVSAENLWEKLAQFHDVPAVEAAQHPQAAAIEQRKAFLPAIAEPLLARVRQSVSNPGELLGLARAILESLQEKHLLVMVDDPVAAAWLAEQAWDGSVWRGAGDYVQIVDSNVGFNKADARVQRDASYQVKLTDDGGGRARLTIEYRNSSVAQQGECVQELVPGNYESNWIDACYWTYLRVYVPAGSQLIDAEPSEWPEGSLWRRSNPAANSPSIHVGRDPTGKEIFGVLVVVPPGEERTVRFDYLLPASAWTPLDGYRLYFEKQSGTIEVPVQVAMQPPDGARVAAGDGKSAGGQVTVELRLRTDQQVKLRLEGDAVDSLGRRPSPTVLPTATPMPTSTPTRVPTEGPSPTPVLLLITATPSVPAPTAAATSEAPVAGPTAASLTWARVQAPAVGIDTMIVPVGWQLVGPPGARYAEWEVAAFSAGYHKDSALPGETGNVVLSGHHNILGEVFRDLWLLEPGDQVFLTDSAGTVYRYTIREVNILPDAGMPPEVRASYLSYLQQTREPILTMVTCWPYESNTHRTIVVADLVP